MEHISPCGAGNRLAVQEILRPLWNPQFHYRVHQNLPVDPVLSQINSVHIVTPHLFKTRFNVVISSIMPRLFKD
jgi:hypothetical protein